MPKKKMISIIPGTQIIYVPAHAKKNLTHKDCRAGFVVSDKKRFVTYRKKRIRAFFCRYWEKVYPWDIPRLELNSCNELVPVNRFIVKNSTPQIFVQEALQTIPLKDREE